MKESEENTGLASPKLTRYVLLTVHINLLFIFFLFYRHTSDLLMGKVVVRNCVWVNCLYPKIP